MYPPDTAGQGKNEGYFSYYFCSLGMSGVKTRRGKDNLSHRTSADVSYKGLGWGKELGRSSLRRKVDTRDQSNKWIKIRASPKPRPKLWKKWGEMNTIRIVGKKGTQRRISQSWGQMCIQDHIVISRKWGGPYRISANIKKGREGR